MIIDEIIGLLVLRCGCGQKFVVNTELAKNGFQYKCSCGKYHRSLPGELNVSFRSYGTGDMSDKEFAQYTKGFDTCNNAPTVEEYKSLLSKIIVDGKMPKVPARNKKVVAFNTNQEAIINTVDALMAMGWSYDDAKDKVSIAIGEGFYTETEIINHILTL